MNIYHKGKISYIIRYVVIKHTLAKSYWLIHAHGGWGIVTVTDGCVLVQNKEKRKVGIGFLKVMKGRLWCFFIYFMNKRKSNMYGRIVKDGTW